MSTSSAPYFFLSYSREDTAKQKRIVRELRERGINVWVDIENLTPGTPTWEREIEKAIRGSTGIVVLLSPESNNSEWVRREISFGEQHRKRIFPVLIEGDDHTSTPLRLVSHQRVDLRTKFESGLDELATAIKEYIGVKEEIATQSQVNIKAPRPTTPALDLKKFGVPALIALVGLLAVGGIYAAVNNSRDETPTPPPVTTVPPDVDPVITETATEPAIIENDEPTGKIIFTCDIQGSEICIMNADGSNWRRLTDTSLASSSASLAPDGRKAVFMVNYGNYSEIHEVDINSGDIQQLTDLNKGLGAPEISPDNRYIIFHYPARNLQLWLMNRDGSNPQELYSESGRDIHDGIWSPDGTRILFALGKGENNKLYIMDFNVREPQLVNDTIDTRGRSDWSPLDLIAFDQGGFFQHDVYTMNLDGSGLTKLTDGTNAQGVSFSPDGQWIAFTAYTNVAGRDQASCEIFIMRADGTDVRQLTNNKYCDYQPRWGN
ncbi:MAG: TIR domain-containing protein [Anaerolineales bacterium]|nr:TIR domain-containing protein [Anaerolineales bacterium]